MRLKASRSHAFHSYSWLGLFCAVTKLQTHSPGDGLHGVEPYTLPIEIISSYVQITNDLEQPSAQIQEKLEQHC